MFSAAVCGREPFLLAIGGKSTLVLQTGFKHTLPTTYLGGVGSSVGFRELDDSCWFLVKPPKQLSYPLTLYLAGTPSANPPLVSSGSCL